MHPVVQILEEVMRLAEDEARLLELEDVEGLRESAEKRAELLKAAWGARQGCDEALLATLLGSIQATQAELYQTAEAKFIATRDELSKRNKSLKAVLGYCKTGVGHGASQPRIFTKFS